jgi:putative transposase
MARLSRLRLGGLPHLLVQRGHNGQPVFVDAADKALFIELLTESVRTHQVALHAYALLDHEIRLLLTPTEAEGLSRLMQSIGRRYGGAFNRRHGRTGSLWDGRFRATVIEPEQHLLQAMRWLDGEGIHNSRAHHVGERPDPAITHHPHFWTLGNTPFDREMAYRQLLGVALTPAQSSQLAEAVQKGWPLGGEAFLARLQQLTERRLAPLPRGRPAKVK